MTVPFDAIRKAEDLARATEGLDADSVLRLTLTAFPPGRIALVSSFGSESAVLLHLVSRIDPTVPVILLDTGKLFGETLRYSSMLKSALGLTDIRPVEPDPAEVGAEDARGTLWLRNPDACCALRKVRPLSRALAPFQAWISGRKRYQAATRSRLPLVEPAGGLVKINPLADWSRTDIEAYLDRHALPRHPLEEDGFQSIGCMPCTDRVAPGEDGRAGRWRGLDKTECGIHRLAEVTA